MLEMEQTHRLAWVSARMLLILGSQLWFCADLWSQFLGILCPFYTFELHLFLQTRLALFWQGQRFRGSWCFIQAPCRRGGPLKGGKPEMDEYEHWCGEQVFLETARSGNIPCVIACAFKRNLRGNVHAEGLGHKPGFLKKKALFRSVLSQAGLIYILRCCCCLHEQNKVLHFTRAACVSVYTWNAVRNWNIDIKAFSSNKARIVKYFKIMMDDGPLNLDFGISALLTLC